MTKTKNVVSDRTWAFVLVGVAISFGLPAAGVVIDDLLRDMGFALTVNYWHFFVAPMVGGAVAYSLAKATKKKRTLEAQLRHSQKMDEVGQLTSGLAHDFNNLLSVVLASAQLASESLAEGARDDVAVALSEITAAARRGAGTVRHLLGFARTTALQVEPTDLGHILAHVRPMLRTVIPEHVDIQVSTEEAARPALVDVGAVEQIVLNLATNARDAMPNGGCLRLGVRDASITNADARERPWLVPGEYVCLFVTDDGVGMDEEVRRKAFEPFFSTKAPGKGTGLGLAMVHGLVTQQGGLLDLWSAPGQGSTFDLYFPVAPERAVVDVEDHAVAVGEARRGTETILFVEDDAALRSVSRRTLEKYGYTVLEAVDGLEALELYRADPARIDLVISDSMMPRMGGRDLFKALGAEAPGLRFLLMSGYQDAEARHRAVGEVSPPFLAKPWDIDEFLTRVGKILDAPNEAKRQAT